MEIKLTKEAILRAASKCPTAKAVLKELAPECFEAENPELEKGHVYKITGGYSCFGHFFAWMADGKGEYVASDIGSSSCGNYYGSIAKSKFVHVADSIEEYFRLKFDGKL